MARTKLALPWHLFGTWAPLLVAGLLLGSVIAVACGDDDRNAAVVEPEPAASETAGGDEASAVAVAAPSEADKSKETPPAVADALADEPAAIEPVEESVPSPAPRANVLSGSAEYAEGVDYFPEKLSIAHAKNFGVEYFANYKVVTVPEPTPGGAAETYVLVQRGTPAPPLTGPLTGAAVIEVPVESIFMGSTTPLPFLVDLDVVDRLTGVASAGLIHAEPVLERIEAGAVVEYAAGGEVDAEAVIEAVPAMLMTEGLEHPTYPILREAGVAVVAGTEWLEPSPLGRAEWLKYVAVFFNREAAAARLFASIEESYAELAELGAGVVQRPRVMTGLMFEGVWYAAGGDSFVARLLRDAGADYVWADNNDTGSLPLDFEVHLERAQDAAYWVNVSLFWRSVADAAAEDARYERFAAYQSGQVWNYTRIQNESGGLEYFERGVSRPDLVLADLLKIFHPDLVPEHTFIWYEQLPAE